jgi:hypothetical protein
MIVGRIVMFAATMLACNLVLAQADQAEQPAPRRNTTVYKCTAADGSVVYADAPCSADPHKVQEIDTSSALRTGSGGHQGELSAGVADDSCRELARKSAYGTVDGNIETSNQHINDYQQRQTQLAAQKAYATDGSGQMVDDPAAPQAIAELDAAIARERDFQQKAKADADVAYQTAAQACDAAAKNAAAQKEGQQ